MFTIGRIESLFVHIMARYSSFSLSFSYCLNLDHLRIFVKEHSENCATLSSMFISTQRLLWKR